MFAGATKLVVNGGLFVENADNSPKGNLDRLLAEVAPNAILNAGGRADEVRCYPGTREEVIQKLENWMDNRALDRKRMMWLSGPAGAGKSAIFQTLAERCVERGRHAANFFFFRDDGTRNCAQPLVATLVYQLLDLYPTLYPTLAAFLTSKPLICKASIEEQFHHLLSAPIDIIRQASSICQPVILLIDGLDECNNERQQEHIVTALHALTEADHSPFLVLVASRADPHLVMSFNKIGSSAESMFLDAKYRPKDDIRRFVIDKFDEIKAVHHLAHTLDKNWPMKVDIDKIVDMSSGQFIYAATVLRFVQYSSASPALSLLRAHGMRPTTSHAPLAQLDAVYSDILSKAEDIHAVRFILGARFIIGEVEVTHRKQFHALLGMMGYGLMEVQSIFADLAALVQVSVSGSFIWLNFYHASLSEFLEDESRSGIFCVGVAEIATQLAPICLEGFHDIFSWRATIRNLRHLPETSAGVLSQTFLKASARTLNKNANIGDPWMWALLIDTIARLYFFTDEATFRKLLQSWVRFAYVNDIALLPTYSLISSKLHSDYRWYHTIEGVRFALGLHT